MVIDLFFNLLTMCKRVEEGGFKRIYDGIGDQNHDNRPKTSLRTSLPQIKHLLYLFMILS